MIFIAKTVSTYTHALDLRGVVQKFRTAFSIFGILNKSVLKFKKYTY